MARNPLVGSDVSLPETTVRNESEVSCVISCDPDQHDYAFVLQLELKRYGVITEIRPRGPSKVVTIPGRPPGCKVELRIKGRCAHSHEDSFKPMAVCPEHILQMLAESDEAGEPSASLLQFVEQVKGS